MNPSGDNTYFRTDIRASQAGVDHRLWLRIIGNANCLPVVTIALFDVSGRKVAAVHHNNLSAW